MQNTKKLFWALAVTLAFSVACEKKRTPEFGQGESLDGLYEVGTINNKEFPVTTKSSMFATENTLSSNKSDDGTNKPLFPLVKYETKAPFLSAFNGESWPLSAKENDSENYSFLYQVTDSNLIIYKKAKKEFLTDSDLIYASKYGQFMIAPQISIPITLYKVEKIKEGGLETNILHKFQVSKVSEAQYFKPDTNRATYLKLASRDFVFPKSFFECPKDENGKEIEEECDWFFAQTVVALKETEDVGIVKGQDLSMDFMMNPVSRVRFFVDQFQLSARNMNIDPELLKVKSGKNGEAKTEDKTDINTDEVLNIGSTAIDFRLKPVSGTETSMDEEVLNDGHVQSQPWKKRKYLKLDFSKIMSLITKSSTPGQASLVSLTMNTVRGQEYFGLTILDNQWKIKMRYSFKRAHKPVSGKLAFDADMERRFGFFTTARHFVAGPEYVRRKDFERNTFVNRFVPQKKSDGKRVIEYYLTDSSKDVADVYKTAAQKAIDIWNESFKKIGSDIEVVLARDEQTNDYKYVELGDIRYNIINLIEEKAITGGLLGYGPSVADTQSGEIISATANIYVTALRRIVLKDLRRMIYYKLGLVTDKQIYNPEEISSVLASSARMLGASDLDIRNLGIVQKKSSGSGVPVALTAPTAGDAGMRKSNKLSTKKDRINSCGNFGISKAEIIKKAEELCQAEIFNKDTGYLTRVLEEQARRPNEKITHIQEYENGDEKYKNYEIQALEACADKVMQEELVHTILHEVGHNFGLRHNFIGSYDVKNFTEKGVSEAEEMEAKKIASSSSVMDYISAAAKPNSNLGPYDLAALRFGYKNEVELGDKDGRPTGKFISLDIKKSIDENMAARGTNARKYLFCTDEDTMSGDRLAREALCLSFDSGTSATEITKNFINEFNAFWETNSKRYDFKDYSYKSMMADEKETTSSLAEWIYFEPLVRIYGEWRIMLAANMKDKTKSYLNSLNSAQYQKLVQDIAQGLSGDEKKTFMDYYVASNLIKDVFLKIIFTSDRYCVAEMKNGSYETAAFEHFKTNIGPKEKLIKDCSDDRVLSHFSQMGEVARINEIGEQYSNHQTDESTRTRKDYWKPDSLGVDSFLASLTTVVSRVITFSVESLNMKFYPALTDDPDMREKMGQMYVERALRGYKYENKQTEETVYLKNFATAGVRLAGLRATLSFGMSGAQEPGMAEFFGRPFRHDMASEVDMIPKDASIVIPYEIDSTSYRYTMPVATVASQVIVKFDALRNRDRFLAPTSYQVSREALIGDMLSIVDQASKDHEVKLSTNATLEEYINSVSKVLKKADAAGNGIGLLFRNIFANVLHKPDLLTAYLKDNTSLLRDSKINVSQALAARGGKMQALDIKQAIEGEVSEVMLFAKDSREYIGQKEILNEFLSSKMGK